MHVRLTFLEAHQSAFAVAFHKAHGDSRTRRASALTNTCENAAAIAFDKARRMACVPSPALVQHGTGSELIQRQGRVTGGGVTGQGQRGGSHSTSKEAC